MSKGEKDDDDDNLKRFFRRIDALQPPPFTDSFHPSQETYLIALGQKFRH